MIPPAAITVRVITIGMLVGCGIAVITLYRALVRVDKVIIRYDSLLTAEGRQAYARVCTEHALSHGPSHAPLAACPAGIARFSCRRSGLQRAYVTFDLHAPQLVDHDQCLLDDGTWIPCQHLVPEALQQLPRIKVAGPDAATGSALKACTRALLSIIQGLPITSYTTLWHNPYAIEVIDHDRSCTFVLTADTALSLSACNELRMLLHRLGAGRYDLRSPHRWAIHLATPQRGRKK